MGITDIPMRRLLTANKGTAWTDLTSLIRHMSNVLSFEVTNAKYHNNHKQQFGNDYKKKFDHKPKPFDNKPHFSNTKNHNSSRSGHARGAYNTRDNGARPQQNNPNNHARPQNNTATFNRPRDPARTPCEYCTARGLPGAAGHIAAYCDQLKAKRATDYEHKMAEKDRAAAGGAKRPHDVSDFTRGDKRQRN